MVEITRTLQGVACDHHVLPPARRVGPGLRSIPVPIPGNPRRHVLVYALELARGVVIINAGWSTDDAREALCGLRQARGWSVAVGNQARGRTGHPLR